MTGCEVDEEKAVWAYRGGGTIGQVIAEFLPWKNRAMKLISGKTTENENLGAGEHYDNYENSTRQGCKTLNVLTGIFQA